jgi:hypothetical protein
LAIANEPVDPDQLWRYSGLLSHISLPEGRRTKTWSRIREIIEDQLGKKGRDGHDNNGEAAKSRGPIKRNAKG